MLICASHDATAVGPQEPTCEGICAISTLPATSYGERVASQPATVAVSGPADPVRPGAEFSVVARLFDAFSQPVRNSPTSDKNLSLTSYFSQVLCFFFLTSRSHTPLAAAGARV